MLILPSLQQRKPFVIGQRNRRRSARVFCCELPDLIERDLEKCARAESIDTSKPISLARRLDIPRSVANFQFFATAILHTESEAHIADNVAFSSKFPFAPAQVMVASLPITARITSSPTRT